MKIAQRCLPMIVLAIWNMANDAGAQVLAVSMNKSSNIALRDPTQPPAAYAAPVGGARQRIDVVKPDHLVTVNGVRFLVWNSRRYAVGDMIDGVRVERISESEIWLRSTDGVRKLAIFSGIEKRPPNSDTPTNSSVRTGLDGNKKGSEK